MSKGFFKFKRKVRIDAWIKSLTIGISFGLIVFSVLYILQKRELFALHPAFCALIGAGVALFSGGLAYLLCKPQDKRLAKRLDNELALHERVQTMLEYQGQTGAIYDLQREDANQVLDTLPKNKLKIRRLWAYVLATVLGVGATVTSFVIPAKDSNAGGKGPEVPFTLTAIQRAALERLIVDVNTSEMQSPYKNNIAASLTELLDGLLVAETISERDEALQVAMDVMLEETDDSSPVVEIVNALWSQNQENLTNFVEAINYYSWRTGKEWDDYAEGMTNFRASFIHVDSTSETPDETQMTKDTAALMSAFASNVSLGLLKSGIEETDSVYAIVTRLSVANETGADGSHLYGLETLSVLAETIGYAQTQSELETTIGAMNIEIFRTLEQSYKNTTTGEFAMTRLSEIFNYPLPKFERPDLNTSAGGDTPTDIPDTPSTTPPGTNSEVVYGSNEKVLDPTTGEIVEYGGLLSGYQSDALDNCTEEEREALKKYYDILAGVNKD